MNLGINKIRSKLILAFLAIIFLAGLSGVIASFYLQRISAYQGLTNKVKDLLDKNTKLIDYERSFTLIDSRNELVMRTNESSNVDKHRETVQTIKKLLTDIRQDDVTKQLSGTVDIQAIKQMYDSYNQTFLVLVDKIFNRGYKDYGLEGQMRETVHNLESTPGIDRTLVLTLRRHEKDFIIRKDLNYVDKLHAVANQTRVLYRGSPVILSIIDSYEKRFDRIVAIEREIGLTEETGLRGKMAKQIRDLEAEIKIISQLITKRAENLIFRSIIVIIAFVTFTFVVSIIVALYFSVMISRPIITLDRVAKSVVKDLKNQETFLDKIQSEDEIGTLAQNFKTMLLKLKRKIQQANEKTLKLEEVAKIEAQRSWHNEGLALFNETFRRNHNDLDRQSFEVISLLVKYTQCTQGGIFIINEDNIRDTYLELKACYAYERRKYLKKRIDLGEGLIGSAWREEQTILITDIPEDYAYISFGLGKAKPNSLLIVPVRSESMVEGVIELISFKQFSQHEIEFVEVLAEKLATVILSIKANLQTQKLLQNSEDQAREAREREMQLQKQIESYEHWVSQFEQKLNTVSEDALVYQSIISKIFAGMILTDEKFVITKVNNFVTKRFNYKKDDVVGQPVDVLIETDYQNIIDLQNHSFKLSYHSFRQVVVGKVIDSFGNVYDVEMISGKLEIDTRIIYVFLFNEYEEEDLINHFHKNGNGQSMVKNYINTLG